jgi:hypothetical protein
MIVSIGNLGGFVGPYMIGFIRDGGVDRAIAPAVRHPSPGRKTLVKAYPVPAAAHMRSPRTTSLGSSGLRKKSTSG